MCTTTVEIHILRAATLDAFLQFASYVDSRRYICESENAFKWVILRVLLSVFRISIDPGSDLHPVIQRFALPSSDDGSKSYEEWNTNPAVNSIKGVLETLGRKDQALR
jgi:hypothetical protein